MLQQTRIATPRDWWEIAPDHASLSAEAWRRAPEMNRSEEGRWVEACRLAELRDETRRPRRKITVES